MRQHTISIDSDKGRALLTCISNLEKLNPIIITEEKLFEQLCIARAIVEEDIRKSLILRINTLDQKRYKAIYPSSTRMHRPLSQKGKKVLKPVSTGHRGSPQVTTGGPKRYTPYN